MAKVWVPSLLRTLCDGRSIVEVEGRTLRQVVENLDAACPGIRARLIEDGELRPELAVAVDGEVTDLGLLQQVREASEIQILPAIGGGMEARDG